MRYPLWPWSDASAAPRRTPRLFRMRGPARPRLPASRREQVELERELVGVDRRAPARTRHSDHRTQCVVEEAVATAELLGRRRPEIRAVQQQEIRVVDVRVGLLLTDPADDAGIRRREPA